MVSRTMPIKFTVSVGRTDIMESSVHIILSIFRVIILMLTALKRSRMSKSTIIEHRLVSFVRENVSLPTTVGSLFVEHYLRNLIEIHVMPFLRLQLTSNLNVIHNSWIWCSNYYYVVIFNLFSFLCIFRCWVWNRASGCQYKLMCKSTDGIRWFNL